LIGREIDRLLTRLEGVRAMKRLPELLFIVDVGREVAAVRESNLLKIPMVALVDTNCNPQNIDYVIPSNDDAIRAIKLLVARMADAVLEGKAMRKEEEPMEETPASAETSTEAKPAKPRKGKHVVEAADVDEVGEGALLGESTLAKLNVSRKPAEVENAPAEVESATAEVQNAPADVENAPAVKTVEEETQSGKSEPAE